MERHAVRIGSFWTLILATSVALLACGFARSADPAPSAPQPKTTLVIVVGADGEETYGKIFAEELSLWKKTAENAKVELHVIGDANADVNGANDKARLEKLLADEQTAAKVDAPLWLVFIGHGTFDGRTAAFNLKGPDVSSGELAAWLKDCKRPLAVVNTTAASAPFLTALSTPGRVVITATKSGSERNYARFGRYFAKRVVDPTADLDKDEQTSLFEAYLAASRDVTEFYKSEGRVATEHPLLDDDGDGRGVRADFFTGAKLMKAPATGKTADGDLARRFCLHPSNAERQLTLAQATRRDELETALASLRRRKHEFADDAYFVELEKLLVALARVYQSP